MGLSPLSRRKLRVIERATGKRVAWGSVFCHHHTDIAERGQWFRFWEIVSPGRVRLGHFNTKTKEVVMTDEYREESRYA